MSHALSSLGLISGVASVNLPNFLALIGFMSGTVGSLCYLDYSRVRYDFEKLNLIRPIID